MLRKLLLIVFIVGVILAQHAELTDEELDTYTSQYYEEQDVDTKAQLELIVKPEKADKNKDRKISKDEVRKAILYIIYPKEDSKKIKVTPEITSHVKGQVDLFVTNLEDNFLNYRQFAKLISNIEARRFVHPEILRRTMEAKDQRRESEGEL